mgnify:CR=1 FL=1
MTTLQIDSPLKWPAHILPTERLKRSINGKFSVGMKEPEALGFLQDEISRTPLITSAKLSCDALNINSPMPTKYLSKNPGVALSLRFENDKTTLCCDKWQSIAHNIYALHLAIRQFRQISEWGIGNLPILLKGFSDNIGENHQTPSNRAGANAPVGTLPWQQLLGLSSHATLEDANAIYRSRAKLIAETDPEALQNLNIAIASARKFFNNSAEQSV